MDNQNTTVQSNTPSQITANPVDKGVAIREAHKLLIIAYTQTLSSLHNTYLQLKEVVGKEQDVETIRQAINRLNSDIEKLKEKLPDKLF